MPVGYPEVYTKKLNDKTWEADIDGFSGIGSTELEAIDDAVRQFNSFLKKVKIDRKIDNAL